MYRLVETWYDEFERVYPRSYQEKYGFWRPVIGDAVAWFLKCGDVRQGFARVRCPDCWHEFFVAFTPDGRFLPLPDLPAEPFVRLFETKVFNMLINQGKIRPELVEKMRAWRHSGFSVHKNVFNPAGDRMGAERLLQYMIRCPFSLARMLKVNPDGKVIYRAEHGTPRRYPMPAQPDLSPGLCRNFQLFDPDTFDLDEFMRYG